MVSTKKTKTDEGGVSDDRKVENRYLVPTTDFLLMLTTKKGPEMKVSKIQVYFINIVKNLNRIVILLVVQKKMVS